MGLFAKIFNGFQLLETVYNFRNKLKIQLNTLFVYLYVSLMFYTFKGVAIELSAFCLVGIPRKHKVYKFKQWKQTFHELFEPCKLHEAPEQNNLRRPTESCELPEPYETSESFESH